MVIFKSKDVLMMSNAIASIIDIAMGFNSLRIHERNLKSTKFIIYPDITAIKAHSNKTSVHKVK